MGGSLTERVLLAMPPGVASNTPYADLAETGGHARAGHAEFARAALATQMLQPVRPQ